MWKTKKFWYIVVGVLTILAVVVGIGVWTSSSVSSENKSEAQTEAPSPTSDNHREIIYTERINFPENGARYILEITDEFPEKPNFSWEQFQKVNFDPKVEVEIKDLSGHIYEAGPDKKVHLPVGNVTYFVKAKNQKTGYMSAVFRNI